MSVALVSFVDPYPTDAGIKVSRAGFIEYFVARYGADNVHYIKVGAPPQQEYPVRVHVVPAPSRAAVLANIATKVMTGRASLEEAFLSSRRTAAAITRVLDGIRPRVQVYDTIRMAQYASDEIAADQICLLDDLFSERYDRWLKAIELYGNINNPLGRFAEHVPPQLQPLATNQVIQKALLRAERGLVRRTEDKTARRFNRCLLVSAEEVDKLTVRAGVPRGRIQMVPPLIAEPTSSARRYTGAQEFVFLGLLSLPHNDDGLRWFLQSVWPTVLAQLPDAHLRVIGREPRGELLTVAAAFPESVTLEGYVPDLSDAIAGAAALVNPLRFGSGIKLKVLEALGRALPVVSTPIGAEGMATGQGTGILVGREPAEIADSLCSLTDPARNAEVSADARTHFMTTYSRPAAFEVYDVAFAPAKP